MTVEVLLFVLWLVSTVGLLGRIERLEAWRRRKESGSELAYPTWEEDPRR